MVYGRRRRQWCQVFPKVLSSDHSTLSFYINDLPAQVHSATHCRFLRMTACCTVLSILLRTKSNSKMTLRTSSIGLLIGVWYSIPLNVFLWPSAEDKPAHIPHFYELCGVALKCVENEKYLRVTLSHDLTWESHIVKITTNANQKLWFIKRNLRGSPCELKHLPTLLLCILALSMQVRCGIFTSLKDKDKRKPNGLQQGWLHLLTLGKPMSLLSSHN